ncbi:biliverdin-producing heme oxygenase [Sphingomonas sp.]|uniref:biliverdin-producing heme oxygenase n=1 Tax=Sphingomonas sp. TaxID=28214 RepID=UPI003AFFCC4B
MAERGEAHQALREATRADHEALDGMFGRFDLGDRDAYRAFLTAHAMALPAVEAALDAAGFADALPDWPERHRADAIAADLAALGAPLPAPLASPAIADAAACWGAAYVLEGSRLGGAFLARQVADAWPKSYLGTSQTPGRWRAFLSALDDAIATPQDIASAGATARAVFALFGEAGRRQLETT